MTPPAFHPEALAELEEQALFYEAHSPGLGERFIARVESAVQLAASMPAIGAPYLQGTRRVFPRGFPVSVIYLPIDPTIVILAIAAFKRRPGYWQSRA